MINTKLQEGDVLNITKTFRVKRREGNFILAEDVESKKEILLEDTNVNKLFNDKDVVTNYSAEEKISMTSLAEMLNNISRTQPFVVSFKTQKTDNRVILGRRLDASETYLGYTLIQDFNGDITGPTKGIKKVDNRNINWLIINGVKYIV